MKKLVVFPSKGAVTRFIPVGDAETGVIRLLKRGNIVAKENPVELQEEDRRAAKLIRLMQGAGRKLAAARGIPHEDAWKKLFPTTVDDGNGKTIQVMAEERLEDWLTASEQDEYVMLAASSGAKKRAVTLFIRYRLAYPVELVKDVQAGASDFEIEPLRFPLPVGANIKFPGFRAIVSQPADIGDERIYVNPLPQSLVSSDIGFLIDPETGKEKIGCLDGKAPALSLDHAREFAGFLEQRGYPGQQAQDIVRLLLQWLEGQTGWTMSDTDELSEDQITAVYAFYQSELGGAAVVEDEGKQEAATTSTPMELPSSQNPPSSTGLTAGSESKQPESVTLSLNGATSETARLT